MRSPTLVSSKAASAAALTLAALLTLLVNSRRVVDDAYIVYRYAYNLRNFGAMEFNLGERVEACTDFLWVVLVSVGSSLPGLNEPTTAMLLSHIFLFLSLLRIWQFSDLLNVSRWAGTAAALLLLLSPDFVQASTNGLESALFGFLLIEMLYRWQSNQISLAFLCGGFLFWTRPESAVLSVLMAVLLLRSVRQFRPLVPGISLWLALVGGLTLFRLFYFGEFVPNSIFAKSFPLSVWIAEKGVTASYFESFFTLLPQFILIFVAGAGLLLFKKDTVNEKNLDLLLFCLMTITYSYIVVARNAGDWMPNFRLLVQYGVVYAAIFLILCQQRQLSRTVCLAILILGLGQTAIHLRNRLAPLVGPFVNPIINPFVEDLAENLEGNLRPTDSISIGDLGWFSYRFINQKIHDPLGLADKYIARHGNPLPRVGKNNYAHTFGVLNPEYVVWIENKDWWRNIDDKLVEPYIIFQYPSAFENNEPRRFVLVRRDRLADAERSLADWPQVNLRELRAKFKDRTH